MTFEEFKTELKNKRNFFYQFPWEVCTYFHWTAGSYTSTFNEYHFCILGDGRIVYTRPLDETPQATWKRNTGNIAISLCCCYNATPDDLGDYPPTDAQIETSVKMIKAISEIFAVPIDYNHFMTHGEAADEDGYGLYSGDPDCRWDMHILKNGDEIGTGGEKLRQMARKTV